VLAHIVAQYYWSSFQKNQRMTIPSLQSIFNTAPDFDSPWQGRYKIPWDDPEFSRRMLREHLSQEHDLASRKSETIDRQVEWIESHCGEQSPLRILDLGCGPGLYAMRLCRAGRVYRGIDISPASIAYAAEHAKEGMDCRFTEADVRTADFGDGYGLAMLLFGELNVFSPDECRVILRKMHASLAPGGRLLVEPQKADAVKASGTAANTWFKAPGGLFSDRPHLCLIENHWDESSGVAVQIFHVLDVETGKVDSFRSTTRALPNDMVRNLLTQAGFEGVELRPDWPQAGDTLMLWSGRRPG
jgi:SAM-dependent methyltransferase